MNKISDSWGSFGAIYVQVSHITEIAFNTLFSVGQALELCGMTSDIKSQNVKSDRTISAELCHANKGGEANTTRARSRSPLSHYVGQSVKVDPKQQSPSEMAGLIGSGAYRLTIQLGLGWHTLSITPLLV